MFKNFLIYLLLLGCAMIGILYYILYEKHNRQNLQLRILTRQVNGLNSELGAMNKSMSNIKVYYHPLSFRNGEIIRRCSLYIAPLSNSAILRTVTNGTKVEIIDSVESLEIMWCEVILLINDNVNLKGFIRQEFIREIQMVPTSVTENRYY